MDALFSMTVMDHFYRPRRVGVLEPPARSGSAGSLESGRFVVITARVEANRIAEVRFKTYGCVPAIAAGSVLTSWVEGMTVQEALQITPEALLNQMGGLPSSRVHCAHLAVEALRNCLGQEPSPC